jgi:hypothetical protein
MKYLRPLYRVFVEKDPKRAVAVFEKNRDGYHPIAARIVSSIVSKGK